MPKYKYFLLFFGGIAILLLWSFFPVSFDNNDDQAMFAIASGLFSGISSPNLILSNIFNGKLLNLLFSLTKSFNWYTLYLQMIQMLCFLSICFLFIKNKNVDFLTSLFLVVFILLSFFTLSIVKLQFTTVALFCCFTALFYLQSEIKKLSKLILVFTFIYFSILIRKESLYIFILFSLPLLIIKRKEIKFSSAYFTSILFALMFFGISVYYNNNNSLYQQQHTYSNVNALDIIAAKPIKINNTFLENNNFTHDDIKLLQSWLVADDAYLSGNKMKELAKSLKVNRNSSEVLTELKKFINDERYLLLIYFMTIISVLFFDRKSISILMLNLAAFLFLLIYLTITSRIPHRIIYPILSYLILTNIFLFVTIEKKSYIKSAVLFLFLILSIYKFYCTAALIKMQNENHKLFANCINEINEHPDYLFIASDGFPIHYMNAWQKPDNLFPAHNLILNGWYACSPDYQVLLKLHRLKNLTSDIKSKENVLFLTQSKVLQNAYVNVMQQRYNIKCHFEDMQSNFTYLHPQKLIIDN